MNSLYVYIGIVINDVWNLVYEMNCQVCVMKCS